VADAEARALAQNVIDEIEDHRWLREARVLLLFRSGVQPNAENQICLGQARRAAPLVALLGERPDFVILLTRETWEAAAPRKRLALLDHELTHCAVTIAGKFVSPAKLEAFVAQLGKRHIETTNITDDKDRTLVRYVKTDADGRPRWRIRHHDVEEFYDVLGRWGAWDAAAARLIDLLEKPDDGQMPLFDDGEANRQAAG